MARFDLNLLSSLDILLREKNVTIAADQIGVSQPTMSGMLGRLRDQLQDPLLVRVGKNYELTARAVELKDPVRQALLTIEELVRPTKAFELQHAERHIRIMASEYSQLLILPHLFRCVSNAAPKLVFEVVPISDPITRVYHGDVDLCLTAAPLGDVEGPVAALIRTQTVLVESFIGLVDQGHPLSDPATLEDILSYPHVATQFPGLKHSVEDDTRSKDAEYKAPAITVPSFIAIAPSIVGTRNIGILPARLYETLKMPWALRAINLPESYGTISLRTLWHARHDPDPLHRWIRSKIQEACALLRQSSGGSPDIASDVE